MPFPEDEDGGLDLDGHAGHLEGGMVRVTEQERQQGLVALGFARALRLYANHFRGGDGAHKVAGFGVNRFPPLEAFAGGHAGRLDDTDLVVFIGRRTTLIGANDEVVAILPMSPALNQLHVPVV